ncbi:MAG: IS1634 family transposase [Planctomycetota bacterium]
MFVRSKKSGAYEYLQVVCNERIEGRVKQRVIATLGRRDVLQKTGQLDALLASCSRFAEHTAVLTAHRQGRISPAAKVRIGPVLVFARLWSELGLPKIFRRLLAERKFEFDVERAVFLTVLHRLFAPGSDRAAEVWRRKYAIQGVEQLQLHHLYRTMAWLGEPLPEDQQAGATPFAPRSVKDLIEEALFQQTRDLFSGLDLVFFDTTSIYFEGEGGETVGQYGHSKDHRPDRKQMVVGVILDGEGRPVCCELWPGNTTDVTTLIPIVDRLKQRFHIRSICVVADRGMISKDTIQRLQATDRDVRYLLGARLRSVKEVYDQVLRRGGRYHEVYGPKKKSKDPAPLKVKEVWVEDRRYIVCHNEDQAQKDRIDREAIVAALRDQLRQGAKSLVGNKGYRRFLKTRSRGGFEIDEAKIESEARFDGKWVLQTDTDLAPAECALKYKELWMVEHLFRSMKSILETRPIYHKCDETIRGHVFCSFLALLLLKELQTRLAARGWQVEWQGVRDDLDALEEITIRTRGRTFVIRSDLQGDAGKAIQAAGVALGSVVRLEAPQP